MRKIKYILPILICSALFIWGGSVFAERSGDNKRVSIFNPPDPVVDQKVLTKAMSLNKFISSELTRLKVKNKRFKFDLSRPQVSVPETEEKTIDDIIQKEILRVQLEYQRAEEKKKLEKASPTYVSNDSRFANFDIRTKSNLTGDQLELMLKGTNLVGLGDSFAKAEQTYGVSAIALIGIAYLESDKGNSDFAVKRNNLFGYGAHDSNPDNAVTFSSKDESIMAVAKHLANNYLKEGAIYYHGVTLEGVNVRYSSDQNWNVKVTNIMNRLVLKLPGSIVINN